MTRDDMDRVEGRFRARPPDAARGRLRHSRTALRARLSAVEFPLAADQSARPTNMAARTKIPRRYPLEVFRAIREVWPQDKPISVRLSCHDWTEGGNTPDDAAIFAEMFKDAGADLIDCSSGQVCKDEKPVYGRLFQTPFADKHPQRSWHRDRSRSVRFRKPTTRIRSSRPAAPTFAPSRGRIWPIPPGPCTKPPKSA